MSEKNSRKLCITKKIKGDIPVNDKFDFEIKVEWSEVYRKLLSARF